MNRIAVLALIVSCSLVGPLMAQEKEMRLTLTDAQGGYCISYLIDPAVAAELAPEGTVLAKAGKGSELSPFLARVIMDEPPFAAWIPAAICIGRYQAAAIDGREVVRAKQGKAVTVITSWVGAVQPMGVEGATAVLLEIAVDESRILNPLRDFGLQPEERTARLEPAEAGDTSLELKVSKAKISWVGHPTGDSRVGSTQSMTFGYGGQRNSVWMVTASQAPATTRLMVGALRIEGKDALSKSLKSSPIRAVGPMDEGGTAEFVFHRLVGR
ncbi:MAG: hypothetical protein ABJC19_04000 [Gemmatimonadota bacterium]